MKNYLKNQHFCIIRNHKLISNLILLSFLTITLSGQPPSNNHPNCYLDRNIGATAGINSLLISGVEQTCDDETLESFSKLNNVELVEYLRGVENYSCFGSKVFYYQEEFTSKLFENSKIGEIAKEAKMLAGNFNGTKSGLYGLLQYLSIATIRDLDDNIYISETNWTNITELCNTLSNNLYSLQVSNSLNDENRAHTNIIAGTLYSICWAHNLPSQPAVLNLTEKLLEDLNSFNSIVSNNEELQYSYYFKYDYLLNTYLNLSVNRDTVKKELHNRFVQNPKFYLVFNQNPYHKILTTLGKISLNENIKNALYDKYQNLPNFAVRALQRIAYKTGYDTTETLYTNYLQQVLWDVYNQSAELSAAKIISATVLNYNNDFDQSELKELVLNVKNEQFPNQHIFEDGKLIFYSSLTDEEVLNLYEALQQVKAQFFRLFELKDDMPVEGDLNETLQVRIYRNRNDYIDFNNPLFHVSSPGGGVYIEDFSRINEDHATLYTWDRNVAARDSNYELEELVRHEYVHYLQGRYLVKGLWGKGNPFYDQNRLTWFDEGMAEFFAGSSANIKIIDRLVTQNSLNVTPFTQMKNVILDASDPYVYAPMIWSAWYEFMRERFKDISHYTRQGINGIAGFDTYMQNVITTDNNLYEEKINCVKNDDCTLWTPQTVSLPYEQMHTGAVSKLIQDIENNIQNIYNVNGNVQYNKDESRFMIEGNFSAPKGENKQQDEINLYDRLDEILTILYAQSGFNNFKYATAYYSNINTGTLRPSATFHIVGPLQTQPCAINGCTDINALNFNINADCEDGSCQYRCDGEIFEEYPQILNYIDKNNCVGKSVSVYYDRSQFYYIYVKNSIKGELYLNYLNSLSPHGTDFGNNYLTEAYNLVKIGKEWSCGCDEETVCAEQNCDKDFCTNGGFYTWNPESCSCLLSQATINGCTNPLASNYNTTANCDDASCSTADCSKFTGTFFFENCGGQPYYFIKTTDGHIYDPYFEEGIYTEVYEGQKVNFNFADHNIITPCNVSEKSILITCLENAEPNCLNNSGTIFFEYCGDQEYFFIETDDGKIFDPYFGQGIYLDVYHGQKVNFDYILNNTNTPCDISEQAITLTCIEEQKCDPLFNDYPWLNNHLNINNCTDEEATLYYDGFYYHYVYIKSNNYGELYFSNGSYYSSDKGDNRLVNHFQLEELENWTCGCANAKRIDISNQEAKVIKSDHTLKLSENKLAFNILPNPAVNKITLNILNNYTEKFEITIFDLMGKELVNKAAKPGVKIVQLNLDNLPKGMYLVKVHNGRQAAIQKLILE